jgi:signal transduction histidine kinase
VFYGLKVDGVSSAQGRSEYLSIKLSCSDFESYVASLLRGFGRINGFISDLIRRSVHEVRGINRDVKSAAERILGALRGMPTDVNQAIESTNAIKSLAEILTARTDFLDYFGDSQISMVPEKVQVHNKFYKTVGSLRRRAHSKGITLEMVGNSNGVIKGYSVFEVIPFILIENAIKYSPQNESVRIIFEETLEKITVRIRNLGPRLSDDEMNRVYDLQFRGSNAVDAGSDGSGIGLFLVKELVDRHLGGQIVMHQSGDPIMVHGIPYLLTEFELNFSRSDVAHKLMQ